MCVVAGSLAGMEFLLTDATGVWLKNLDPRLVSHLGTCTVLYLGSDASPRPTE